MESARFTALGMTGSGKTCYLLGMYSRMCSGFKGYTLSASDDIDVEVRRLYERMNDATLGQERFPMGTDSATNFAFSLQHAYKNILNFDWLDYPGGALREKNAGNLDEYQQIVNSINTSSTLFIFVDGELFLEDDCEIIVNNVREKCSGTINHFISKYRAENNRIPPIGIIITKYDLCMGKLAVEDIKEIIQEAFNPLFIKNSNSNCKTVVAIIPVSIGRNISDEDYSGQLKPINIHLPIFMGILFALKNTMSKFSQQFYHCQQNERKWDYDLKREQDKWLFKDKKRIKQLGTDLSNSINRRKKLKEELSLLENYSKNILKELEQLPFIYLDGSETTVDELYSI